MKSEHSQQVNLHRTQAHRNSLGSSLANETCTETLANQMLSPIQEEVGGSRPADSLELSQPRDQKSEEELGRIEAGHPNLKSYDFVNLSSLPDLPGEQGAEASCCQECYHSVISQLLVQKIFVKDKIESLKATERRVQNKKDKI